MKLTPIRIRGKRKRPPEAPAATAVARPRRDDSRDPSSAAEGRPASSAALPSSARRAKSRPVPFHRRFPFEILERIFLLSENLNLPKCSPHLGWLLSGRRTLIEMTIVAFQPTWDLYNVIDGQMDMAAEESYRRFSEKIAKSQTSILACRWAKADLLLDAEHLWMQRRKIRENACSSDVRSLPVGDGKDYQFVVNPSRVPDLLRLLKPDEPQGRPDPKSEDANSVVDVRAYCCNPPPPRDPSSVAVLSVYPCFAMRQLFYMRQNHQLYDAGPSQEEEEDPIRLRLAHAASEADGPPEYKNRGYASSGGAAYAWHARGRMCRHVHDGARIPEWLLLGGGPYVPYSQPSGGPARDPAQSTNTREYRNDVRRRLRTAFDTLYWVVHAGGCMSPMDTWEVALQGVKYLLDIDVTPREEEEAEFAVAAEQEARDKRLKDWGPGGTRSDMVLLGYSLDSLVAGYLSLYTSLGVFQCCIPVQQWHVPRFVLHDLMRNVTERVRDEPALQKTQTYRFMQRTVTGWGATGSFETRAA